MSREEIVQGLVHSLANDPRNKTSRAKLERIISFLPVLPSPTPVDYRQQILFLALAEYVNSTNEQSWLVLKPLLNCLAALPLTPFRFTEGSHEVKKISLDLFSYELTSKLLRRAALSKSAAEKIIPAILSLLASYPDLITQKGIFD